MNNIYMLGDLFIRFEPGIDGGTTFIFNKENGEIFEGDISLYHLLSMINGKNTLGQILEYLSEMYAEEYNNEFVSRVKMIIEDLVCQELIVLKKEG